MNRSVLACTSGLLMAFSTPALRAQDFRVETDVFIDNRKEPAAEFLTLFHGMVIYDFLLSEPQEITIFDASRGRFLLLDPTRKVKTELTTGQVQQFNDRLRERAGERDSDFFEPRLVHQYDAATGWHELTGDRLTYRAKGVRPPSSDIVDRYRLFADWYAQLSAMRPGNLPPFPRMELNKVLAKDGLVPEDVERIMTVARVFPPKKITARSHHLMNWRLSEQDHKRIRTAGDQISEFRTVEAPDYFQLDRVAAQN
jgi:hypothetical protein